MQVVARREGDGMEQEVEPAEPGAHGVEHRFERSWGPHVAGQQQRAGQRLGNRFNTGACSVVEIGGDQGGALLGEVGCAAGRDRMRVGDADHEPDLAGQIAHRGRRWVG
jgi:hypothetical protein